MLLKLEMIIIQLIIDPISINFKICCQIMLCGRTLTQRMSEHKRAVKNSDSNNALAVHVKQSSHNIQWEEANILIREGHWPQEEDQGRDSH